MSHVINSDQKERLDQESEDKLDFPILVNSLSHSYEIWGSKFQRFLLRYESDFHLSSLGDDHEKIEFMFTSIVKLKGIVQQLQSELTIHNINEMKVYLHMINDICDCLRICARSPSGLDQVFSTIENLECFVLIVHSPITWIEKAQKDPSIDPSMNLSIDMLLLNQLKEDSLQSSITALRCLINILFNSSVAFQSFCLSTIHIQKIVTVFKAENITISSTLAHQCIKLLFLISAQKLECFDIMMRIDLFHTLVTSLSWLMTANLTDQRSIPIYIDKTNRLLAKEICKLLNALKIGDFTTISLEYESQTETLTIQNSFQSLNQIVTRVLAISVHDNLTYSYFDFMRSYEGNIVAFITNGLHITTQADFIPITEEEKDMIDFKKLVLQVAMHLGPSLADSMVQETQSLIELCYLLGLQLTILERTKISQSEDAVLTSIATDSLVARKVIKSIIFPNSPPQNKLDSTIASPNEVSEEIMHARDAPKGTIRGMLIKLMTSLSHHIKRSASELLYILCDENADEFVLRTGYGNAVAQLQIKGLLGNPTALS